MKKLISVFYFLCQPVWCLPQNFIGLILFCICHIQNKEHKFFRGAVVTSWNRDCCASIGCFIFMDKESFSRHRNLLIHEYGHTLQSLILGWLYLPIIFLPSVLWFSVPYFRKIRKEKKYSYYEFYTEHWANTLAEKICKEKPIQ